MRKHSAEYRPGVDPPCPSVALDGTVIARDSTVTYEALEAALLLEGS